MVKLGNMRKTKLTPISAKNKLKSYYDFKEVDFFDLDGTIYLNCKDNAGEKAIDVLEDLEMQRKEKYEK